LLSNIYKQDGEPLQMESTRLTNVMLILTYMMVGINGLNAVVTF